MMLFSNKIPFSFNVILYCPSGSAINCVIHSLKFHVDVDTTLQAAELHALIVYALKHLDLSRLVV